MSTWADLQRELRDAEMTDLEFRALRRALTNAMKHFPPHAKVEMPGVSKAGKPYLLTIPTDDAGKPTRIIVDLDPDLSAPSFDALTDFIVKCKAEDEVESKQGVDRG